MTTVIGTLSGIIIAGSVLFAIVYGAIATRRERRDPVRPLIRPDVDSALRESGCYVVHAESHFDLQLTLF
jgi:hypothetical protein